MVTAPLSQNSGNGCSKIYPCILHPPTLIPGPAIPPSKSPNLLCSLFPHASLLSNSVHHLFIPHTRVLLHKLVTRMHSFSLCIVFRQSSTFPDSRHILADCLAYNMHLRNISFMQSSRPCCVIIATTNILRYYCARNL